MFITLSLLMALSRRSRAELGEPGVLPKVPTDPGLENRAGVLVRLAAVAISGVLGERGEGDRGRGRSVAMKGADPRRPTFPAS